MRTLLALLILAVPVMAGPGSWTATRYGSDETKKGTPGKTTGNATLMEVIANAVNTTVAALLMSGPISANEKGAGSAADTVWYELKFSGNKDTTNHFWAIETDIHGEGEADAEVTLQGSAWFESLQVISVTGDNTNSALGQLAVTDEGNTKIALSIPPRVSVALAQTSRSVGTSNFEAKRLKKTTGAGKICRIRVEADAVAQGVAKTIIGHASASGIGNLRCKLEMTGSCTVAGKRVIDTFRISGVANNDLSSSVTEDPSGETETKLGEVPTDDPADDEPEENEDAEKATGDTEPTAGTEPAAGTDPTGDGGAATADGDSGASGGE